MIKNKKTMFSAILLSGIVAMALGPTWAQEPAPRTGGDQPGAVKQKDDAQRQQQGTTGAPAGQRKDDAVREQGRTQTGAGERIGAPAGAGQQYSRETVREVQQALKEKGHNPGAIDGVMGPKTQQALRAFQKEENLKATGTLDQETAQKLGVTLNDRAPGAAGDRPRAKSPERTKPGEDIPQQKKQ